MRLKSSMNHDEFWSNYYGKYVLKIEKTPIFKLLSKANLHFESEIIMHRKIFCLLSSLPNQLEALSGTLYDSVMF